MYQQTTFPTLFGCLPLIRQILLRESISLMHVHGAFSTLALEAALFARTMGYAVRGVHMAMKLCPCVVECVCGSLRWDAVVYAATPMLLKNPSQILGHVRIQIWAL